MSHTATVGTTDVLKTTLETAREMSRRLAHYYDLSADEAEGAAAEEVLANPKSLEPLERRVRRALRRDQRTAKTCGVPPKHWQGYSDVTGRESVTEYSDEGAPGGYTLTTREVDPDETMWIAAACAAVQTLPPEQVQILTLTAEGLPIREVAAQLGIARSTAQDRLSSARNYIGSVLCRSNVEDN